MRHTTLLFRAHSSAATLLFAVLICNWSCGLFSTRPVEEPGDVPGDPLRLATLLDGMPVSFSKVQHEDIFATDCVYEHPYLTPISSDDLLFRLKEIVIRYDSIYVHWIRDSLETRRDDFRGDSATLYRIYAVCLNGDSTRIGDDFRGRSVFRLRRVSELNTWVIYHWEDKPLDSNGNVLPVNQKSFFHPDFED